MNGAGRKLNSPDCNLCIGPVDGHNCHHAISNGTFDYWRIPFKDSQRYLLNGIKDADWNLNELILIRYLANVFPKRTEHDYLLNGPLVFPE